MAIMRAELILSFWEPEFQNIMQMKASSGNQNALLCSGILPFRRTKMPEYVGILLN